MEILPTTRGQGKLVLEGFIYVKQKVMADGKTMVYECEQRRKGLCNARVKVKDNAIVERYEHSHASDYARVEALKVRVALKLSGLVSEKSAAQIIAESIASINDATVSKLPKLSTLSKTICKQRRSCATPKKNSRQTKNKLTVKIVADCVDNFGIVKEFQKTLRGDDFLLYDNQQQSSRVLILGTKEALTIIEQSDHWFCDSAFKILPELSCHLVCVNSINKANLVVPCLYGLLPDQNEKSYNELFREILNLKPNLCPRRISSDFKLAAMKAFGSTWPHATIDGCFYHLSQDIYQKVQKEGLAGLYATDGDFSLYIKMIAALAFIPSSDVVGVFEDLQEVLPSSVEPICNYFEDNYIGTLRGRVGTRYRQAPNFPISLWNVYDRVGVALVLINTHIEEWHRSFQAKVDTNNIKRFFTVLQKDEDANHTKIQQTSNGDSIKLKTDNITKILDIVRTYDRTAPIVYLRDISYHIAL